ncbi:hypothetical protein PHYSODRAFT_334930 [Phytophthora sojae]|uniref:Uncharacterized protein n=1 Tax=Phytophthora sojae (strain P6497) TaxID=1094619 RepID=G4ZTH0_PHYSP|nr:hypothetical protein PHYSODRAFT_334930 [Phytophthora sojae]EGZ13148.1 hypothetical protein PHYSODRAFT_334930 [Phytophthora sojae]|eukprot:XP_009530577.1 hypothetical protein PHYSODRAFT_334930 [Phytophthora sojae]
MRKLQMLGTTEVVDFRGSEFHWACRFSAARVQGWQVLDDAGDSRSSMLTSLLGLSVSPVFQLVAKQDESTVAPASKRPRLEDNKSPLPAGEMISSPSTLCRYVVAKDVDFAESRDFIEVIAALARTPMSTFTLCIADDYGGRDVDLCAVVENGGFALNALLRGRVVCQMPDEVRSSLTFAKIELDTLLLDLLGFIGGELRTLSIQLDEWDPDEEIELDTLLLDLLGLIGGELRTQSIQSDEWDPDEEYDTEHVADIDLCALAVVCPKLEVLQLVCFDVVVQSTNSDALCKWPIKKMNIINSENVPNLGPYLSNPATRIARGLTELRASRLDGEEFAGAERDVLEAHDGECLPIAKEKFPTEAKVAMLSTMRGGGAASDPEGKQPATPRLAETRNLA